MVWQAQPDSRSLGRWTDASLGTTQTRRRVYPPDETARDYRRLAGDGLLYDDDGRGQSPASAGRGGHYPGRHAHETHQTQGHVALFRTGRGLRALRYLSGKVVGA